jgi:hypothetical protein
MSRYTAGCYRETTDALAKCLECSTGKTGLHHQHRFALLRFSHNEIARRKTSNFLVRRQENGYRSFEQRRMHFEVRRQSEHERQSATHVNRSRSEHLAVLDSGRPLLAFPQAPHGIEVAQDQNGLSTRTRASPLGKNVVTRFAILEDLTLRPAPAKLPGKPVGELIEGLLVIRRGVRVHEPTEPLNHLRLKRSKK